MNEDDEPRTDRGPGSGRVLTVRVETTDEYFERGARAIEAAERGEEPPTTGATLSLPSYEELQRLLSPKNVELLETIRTVEPDSIRELARLVERDVSRVHDNVTELARLGVVELVQDGRAKRPVVGYDHIEVEVPIGPGSDGTGLVHG